MQTGASFVRPMTLSEIFRNALVLYRRHFGPLVAITLVYSLLYYPLQALIQLVLPETFNEIANLLIAPLLNFAYAATVVATSNAVLGRPVKVFDAYRRVLTGRIALILLVFVLPFQLVAYLYGLLYEARVAESGMFSSARTLLDFVALPVVIVSLHALLIFRASVAVLEKRGLLDTLRRVLRLFLDNLNRKTFVIGYLWKLVYFWLILLVPTLAAAVTVLPYVWLTNRAMPDASVWLVMNIPTLLFDLFVSPYGLLLAILLYYDVRARKEAFNEMVLAEEMGYQPITEFIAV